jgi:hypothetical protein
MPCVSDTGATAPISALTYAFSIGSIEAHKADDSEAQNHRNGSPWPACVRRKGDAQAT